MSPEALKDYLLRCGLSEAEFAEIIGVTKGAVLHWINGRRDIPLIVVKLIDYFEHDIRDFGGE